ncbi:MAG: hypothetical protein WDO74_23730 [Pseudomonadota bacterium]
MIAWFKASPWRIAISTAILCVAVTWLVAWGVGRIVLRQNLAVDAAVLLTEGTKACGAFASSLISALILKRYDSEIVIDRAIKALRHRINALVSSPEARALQEIGAAVHSLTEASLVANAPQRVRFAECVQGLLAMVESLQSSSRQHEMHPRFATLEALTDIQRLSINIKAFTSATSKTEKQAGDIISAVRQLSESKRII